MAFLAVQTNNGDGGADRLPVLSYNAKAGRLFTLDRVQDPQGNWSTTKVDVTMKQPAFAVDFGTLEIGWLFFSEGAGPMMFTVPYGQVLPVKPPSPGGTDDNGRPKQFKQGFRVKVIGQEIGGVRELAGNAGAAIEGLNNLHTDYEAAPEAAAGMIPLVKMTNVLPLKSGKSENFMPVYAIERWVPRPASLGERTVPVPVAGARTSAPPVPAPAPAPTNHVPPPVKAPTPAPISKPAAMAMADDEVPFAPMF